MPIRRHRTATEPSRQPPNRRRQIALVFAVSIILVTLAAFIGQAGSSSPREAATGITSARPPARSGATSEIGRAPETTMVGGGGGASADAASFTDQATTASTATAGTAAQDRQVAAPIGPKVVRTGSIEVEVGRHRFDDARNQLQTIATGAGGFVSASETSSLDGDPHGSITLRVPVAAFDGVLSRITKLGTVRSSTTGSQDVTGEYSDVAARIRALDAERDQIGLVLAKADTIVDILSVRDRLSTVQGELEQLQGRQQVLDDQTSLSTVTVALSEKGASPIALDRPAERRGLSKVWHESIDRIGDGGRAIALGFAAMLPWLLLALVLWLPVRGLWRRLVAAPAGAAPTPPRPSSPPPTVTAAD